MVLGVGRAKRAAQPTISGGRVTADGQRSAFWKAAYRWAFSVGIPVSSSALRRSVLRWIHS